MFLYLKNILQLLLSPSRGWEDVAATSDDTYHLIHRFLFPLFGVMAPTVFIQLIYHNELPVLWLIVKAVVMFVAFFVTYFFSLTMFHSFFYDMREGGPEEHKVKVVIGYVLALLAISQIICNLMPVNFGLKYLLPLAVAMIMWKSDVYLRVKPDKDLTFGIFGIITTIAPPLLIQLMFDLFIG